MTTAVDAHQKFPHAGLPQSLQLGRDAFGSVAAISAREWLVTNGIGGFASGTIGGLNTRRYHGLLIAALRPPLERTLLVSKLDARVYYGDGDAIALATNEYADGTVDPQGYKYLEAFRLDGQLPVWTWIIGDALLEQRIWMPPGENTTYINYRLLRASQAFALELQPFCAYRDYHAHQCGYRDIAVAALANGFEIMAYPGAHSYRIVLECADAATARWQLETEWHWNFKHREESARGLDAIEDLFRPATIKLNMMPGEAHTVIVTAEDRAHVLIPAALSLQNGQARQHELIALAQKNSRATAAQTPDWIRQLQLSADQFIVERRDAENAPLGKTVIAGYPWFGDWGRDTMIALPGLTLSVGRADIAASILRMFSRFVSAGMLPNHFPDKGEAPEYNTVDAALWYFVAVDEYLRRVDDAALRNDLYPILQDIIEWHLRGTRYSIGVDTSDDLLSAGAQLTWMDAKVGARAVTPRSGKCVEINALWFNALTIMRELALAQDDQTAALAYAQRAKRVAINFNNYFWNDIDGFLYDVIDDPHGEPMNNGKRCDASLRPNQLFAISLRHALLDQTRARAVVAVCARELWTPVGLRSLAARDARYRPLYQGNSGERDSTYHQGTVWSWLLGPFISAHLRAYGDIVAARGYLDGMAAHLREGCIGQIGEIFDGDAPFTARGCYAQAWGVAEILRVWSELHER